MNQSTRPPVSQVVARIRFAAGQIRAGGNADGLADALLKDAENYEILEAATECREAQLQHIKFMCDYNVPSDTDDANAIFKDSEFAPAIEAVIRVIRERTILRKQLRYTELELQKARK